MILFDSVCAFIDRFEFVVASYSPLSSWRFQMQGQLTEL